MTNAHKICDVSDHERSCMFFPDRGVLHREMKQNIDGRMYS